MCLCVCESVCVVSVSVSMRVCVFLSVSECECECECVSTSVSVCARELPCNTRMWVIVLFNDCHTHMLTHIRHHSRWVLDPGRQDNITHAILLYN